MICTKCLEDKSEDEFHANPSAKSGKRSTCKACVSERMRVFYLKNQAEIRAQNNAYYYENRAEILARMKAYYRENQAEIIARTNAYSQTEAGKATAIRRTRKQQEKSPEKIKARNMVRSAIKSGKLIRMPCEVCGETKVEAHHEDYTEPLKVRWLCNYHHRETEGRLI